MCYGNDDNNNVTSISNQMDDRRKIEEDQNERKIKGKKSNKMFTLANTAITEPLVVVFSIFMYYYYYRLSRGQIHNNHY